MLGLGLGIGNGADSDSTAVATHTPLDYSTSLVSWHTANANDLTFDGSNFVTLWEDHSGNGNHLVNGDSSINRRPTWDASNQCLLFINDAAQAHDDRMDFDLTSSSTDSGETELILDSAATGFSIGFILSSSDWQEENQALVGNTSDNNSTIRYQSGTDLFKIDIANTDNTGSANSSLVPNPVLSDDTITHLVFTKGNGTATKLYVNGTVQSGEAAHDSGYDKMFINRVMARSSNAFNLRGKVKDIYIYRRVLSQTDVNNLHLWAATRL